MSNSNSKYVNSPYIWDYKIKKSDLNKPEVKKFWLERKINACDWKDIKKKDLKEYLPNLDIRTDLKELLTIFLKHESK